MSKIDNSNSNKKNLWQVRLAFLLIIIFFVLSLILTMLAKHSQAQKLALSANMLAKVYVQTITADASSGIQTLALPGTLKGYIESPIYARTNGYVLHWYKDIGSHVKKGELLASIDTPEVDQSLALAIATLNQKKSAFNLAESSFNRWQKMRERDVVSQQELDERKSLLMQAEAELKGAEADVTRLTYLSNFKKVTAPFSGIITQRNIDVGDLISTSDAQSQKLMFMLSQSNPLRLYVDIPQAYADHIHINQSVTATLKEMPTQVFPAKIVHTAGAIDPVTRTLHTEILIKNDHNQLLPGSLVKVSIPIESKDVLKVPLNAMLFRAQGATIATVTKNCKVKIKPVSIGQDFGNRLEIIKGLDSSDQIILNPPDSIEDGDIVEVTH